MKESSLKSLPQKAFPAFSSWKVPSYRFFGGLALCIYIFFLIVAQHWSKFSSVRGLGNNGEEEWLVWKQNDTAGHTECQQRFQCLAQDDIVGEVCRVTGWNTSCINNVSSLQCKSVPCAIGTLMTKSPLVMRNERSFLSASHVWPVHKYLNSQPQHTAGTTALERIASFMKTNLCLLIRFLCWKMLKSFRISYFMKVTKDSPWQTVCVHFSPPKDVFEIIVLFSQETWHLENYFFSVKVF